MIIKGYKIFCPDWTCRGKQYTCPGEFIEEGRPIVCKQGMHFCRKLTDCLFYYPLDYIDRYPNHYRKTHVAEVMTDSDKCVFNTDIVYEHDLLMRYTTHKHATSELHILRELTDEEIMETICHEVKHDICAVRALIMGLKAYDAAYIAGSRSFELLTALTKILEQQKGVDD